MSDPRDTNHDGHVSITEKIKDKLHLHRRKSKKDKKGRTSDPAVVGYPIAQPVNQNAAYGSHGLNQSHTFGTNSSGFDSRDSNHDGHVSTSEKLATSSHVGTSTGFDSRDLNRDGHVSTSEKLATSSHSGVSSSGFDSRDLNRDGHVSTSEKLATDFHTNTSAGFDSRDANHDGHVSASERLHQGQSAGFHDSRDLNRDGHVSMDERLAVEGTGSEQARMRLYEEQLAVSKREVCAGEINLLKRVQEEYVQREIPVTRQEIVMERRPYSGDDSTRVPEKDEIARVILYREEVVTEKRLVPNEEVVVRKDVVTDQATVGATLRSEYVETSQVGSKNFASTSGTYGYSGDVSPGKKLKAEDNVYMKAARG